MPLLVVSLVCSVGFVSNLGHSQNGGFLLALLQKPTKKVSPQILAHIARLKLATCL